MLEYISRGISFIEEIFYGVIDKLFIAGIILLIGFIIGKVISRLVQKVLHHIGLDIIIKDTTGIKISIEDIISHFILYFIYFISIIMALRKLGIAPYILNIVSALVGIIITVFLVLSLKDFVPSMIAGIIITQKAIVKEGEYIEACELKGKVISVSLIETKIQTKSGDIILIPNSHLIKKTIIKKTPKKARKK